MNHLNSGALSGSLYRKVTRIPHASAYGVIEHFNTFSAGTGLNKIDNLLVENCRYQSVIVEFYEGVRKWSKLEAFFINVEIFDITPAIENFNLLRISARRVADVFVIATWFIKKVVMRDIVVDGIIKCRHN